MYDQIAHYYELTHAELAEDVAWVVAHAQQVGGPVLELGCGSGRLLWPLAESGFTVVGVDSSAEMLAIAQRKWQTAEAAVQSRITLVQGDMTQLALPQRDFGLAIIPYNTLMHLAPPQLGRALAAIATHLRPHGRLLIDTANPLWLAATEPSPAFEAERTFPDPLTGEQVTQYAWVGEATAEQTLPIAWRFVATGEMGERVVEATAVYHYYYPHQLQLALATAGFQLDHIAGGYAHEPFDEESERLLIIGCL